ncbi:uncharacterized protein LOC134326204 [Trichomycterus rosablanca]|uniref:uncharacterized protein LOC134326204 n=1 Tax=Trichomycterus rosablanca TaxID=2290929 RepID=UPI002F353DA4
MMPYRIQRCPVCGVDYSNLSQHLRKYHLVGNAQEKTLLLQLASGRIRSKFTCCVPGCVSKSVKRLDRHNATVHSDLELPEMNHYANKAKTNYVLCKLAELRASHPQVPMVTTLDIGHAGRLYAPAATSAAPDTAASQATPVAEVQASVGDQVDEGQPGTSTDCQNPTCVAMARRLRVLESRLNLVPQGACPRKDCQESMYELGRLQRLLSRSPQISLRKKFSRRDTFRIKDSPRRCSFTFWGSVSGPTPPRRRRKMPKSRVMSVSHVRRFLIFAGEDRLLKGHFSFLKKQSSIKDWVGVLLADKLKPTTVRANLMSLKKFFEYLPYVPRKTTKLTRVDFLWLNTEVTSRIKDMQRDVTCHRQAVRKAASKNIVSEEDQKNFRREVRLILPAKIKSLKKGSAESLHQVFGLLTGYFVSMSGHRAGVLKNLKVEEVRNAEVDGEHATIDVEDHAQLSLTLSELQWFDGLLSVRDQFVGSESPYFFFNSVGGRCEKVLSYFKTEWTRMGFGGSFTFRHLRTSMVHHTKNLTPHKRLSIHRAMCHSEAVASKFYVPLNTVQEAAGVRRLQEGEEEPEDRPHCSSSRPSSSRPSTLRSLRQEFGESGTVDTDSSGEDTRRPEKEKSSSEEVQGSKRKHVRRAILDTSSESDEPFVLRMPRKSSPHPGYDILGGGPSPEHNYVGTPVKVSQDAMKAITESGKPTVRLSMLVLTSSSSSDKEEQVEEMPLEPSATF